MTEEPDPIAELRRKFLADLKAAEVKQQPTARQVRVWEFLRWSYHRETKTGAPPTDSDWLYEALARLDELDP
jgi:hypothetical protein